MIYMEINNLESLDILVRRKKLKRFTFNFSTFSERENEQWLARISRYYFSCGCQTGNLFLVTGIVMIALLTAYRYFNSTTFNVSLQVIVVCVIVLTSLSGIGKAIGLIHAKWLLNREITCLKRALKNVKDQTPSTLSKTQVTFLNSGA